MALVGSVCIDNLAKTWPIFEAIVHTVTLKFLLFVLILLPIMPCLDTPGYCDTVSEMLLVQRKSVSSVHTQPMFLACETTPTSCLTPSSYTGTVL